MSNKAVDDYIKREVEFKHQSCLNLVNQLEILTNGTPVSFSPMNHIDSNGLNHKYYYANCSELRNFIDSNNEKSNIRFVLKNNVIDHLRGSVDTDKKQMVYELDYRGY